MSKAIFFLRACIALAAAVSAPVSRADAIPVEAFFANPAIDNVELSPNGRHLAVQMARKDGRVMLATMDIETRKPQALVNFSDVDVAFFRWVNDNRLVFSLNDRESAPADRSRVRGNLHVINRDGSGFRQLRGVDALFGTAALQDSDEIFGLKAEYTNKREVDRINLLRLNTSSNTVRIVPRPGMSRGWLVDQNDVARVTVAVDQSKTALYYKDSADAEWRKLMESDRYSVNGIEPVFIAADGTFYVKANRDGDKAALYTFDVKNNRLNPEPVLALPGYDFNGVFIHDAKKVLGIRYETDAEATVWFDERMKQIQKEIDDLLPATVNRVSTSVRNETSYVLVRAYSDIQPGIFFLYNTETHKLEPIGKSHPAIDARMMSGKDMVRYAARDGLQIPAYLTLPKGRPQKNLPMVVLVHGGPWLRGGHWEWDPEVQFLASRGYAVLEPEFRGSTGFGFHHFKAGWKEWGGAMQDDIADGAKWAIAQGIADPGRICIAGASYGGYAALMGLIKDVNLFRCGIDWVGVTDIDLMYSAAWSDLSTESRGYVMPVLIGDREKDAERLKAVSPVHNAARLAQPLLMAYGGVDRRVPIAHGSAMRDALKPFNKNVEWVEYEKEGHGWKMVETRVDFWTRVEKFLERNIGK